ncbi:MAG: hypothetical protein K0U63_07555, partial [Cyanobacteria bacterium]|nr:hypothetical protein [Cyanobacteriota bacterium]
MAPADIHALASPALPAALPKVVAVGFNKCATRSLARLFARSGHRAVHQKLPHRWRGRRKLGGIMRANHEMGKPLFSSVEDYT